MDVKQVVPFVWPEGEHRPIAMLDLKPPELTRRYGLDWEEGCDQLDYYRRAAIELVDGSVARLLQYPRAPEEGTGTLIFALIDTDWDRVRALVLQALDLPPSAYSWVSPLTAEERKEIQAQQEQYRAERAKLRAGASRDESLTDKAENEG